MAIVGFCVSRRLEPSHPVWADFMKLSSLTHVTEVVGLDCSLCPRAIDSLNEADYQHLVYDEYLFGVFETAEYAVRKSPLGGGDQLLAIMREPSGDDLRAGRLDGFTFKGFDLIDEETEVSALTNCGGFPNAFAPRDLNVSGLVADRDRAYAIRERRRQEYPHDSHSDCAVWAIWRHESSLR